MAEHAKYDIGLIGLGVMGQNLALNLDDHGYRVAVYERIHAMLDDFINGPAQGRMITETRSLDTLVAKLKRPRKVMLMIKAGKPIDECIETLLNLLETGDIIIDGGNSHYRDSIRRASQIEARGLLYVGMGISGGEAGARFGPSMMPGGSQNAWPMIKDIFQSIAAKADDGKPCCDWVGENGAGHFVKMVHNGIEYGDMQLIAEAYHLMKSALWLSYTEMAGCFAEWNKGCLNSYLIEITNDILLYRDHDGEPLIEKILDTAGQKGTGRWSVVAALEMGLPLTLVMEAVQARSLSSMKEERQAASRCLGNEIARYTGDPEKFIEDMRQGLYAAKIISYTQGFMLLRDAARSYDWNYDLSKIASLWQGGCIIRSKLLNGIKDAYNHNPNLTSILMDPYIKSEIHNSLGGWRRIVANAVSLGIPVPALSSALAFFDGYRLDNLPANLIQAQRDYFGAHTYERNDKPRGEFFHTDWIGSGNRITAGTYQA